MDALLKKLALLEERDQLLLRGGMLTRRWYPPGRRTADDLDFLALFPYDPPRIVAILEKLAPVLEWAPIWEDTSSPGLRAVLSTEAGPIQVDVATGDPVQPPPERMDGLLVPRRETMMAWKLHGLFEREDGYWRPKDLADLWAIGAFGPVDEEALKQAIETAFTSRDCPFRVADRLVEGQFGQSASSKRTWRKYGRDKPWLPELDTVLHQVRGWVTPALVQLRGPRLPRFAHVDDMAEVVEIAREAGFGIYDRGDCTVLSYEVQSREAFPPPKHAPTFAEHRRRKLLRECRGLTFDRHGKLAARKLHKFFNLPHNQRIPDDTRVLEKLDGSLVTALLLDGQLVLHTRRGPSDIATAAMAHADRELCMNWLESGYTPMFEWCWSQHRIVLQHDQDRLVLIAIRQMDTGAYAPQPIVTETAMLHGVPWVKELGLWGDRDWRSEVAGWTGREGVVLRTPDDRFWKLKSDWYRTAHRAIEGPHPERARWALVLEGRRALLDELGLEVDPLLDLGRRRLADWARRAVDDAPDKKALAQRVGRLNRIVKNIAFRVWDGQDPAHAVDAILLTTLRTRGRWNELVDVLERA